MISLRFIADLNGLIDSFDKKFFSASFEKDLQNSPV